MEGVLAAHLQKHAALVHHASSVVVLHEKRVDVPPPHPDLLVVEVGWVVQQALARGHRKIGVPTHCLPRLDEPLDHLHPPPEGLELLTRMGGREREG